LFSPNQGNSIIISARDLHIWNQTNPSSVYSQIHTVKLRFAFRTFIQKHPHKSEVPFISAFKSATLLDLISKLFSKIQLTGLPFKVDIFVKSLANLHPILLLPWHLKQIFGV